MLIDDQLNFCERGKLWSGKIRIWSGKSQGNVREFYFFCFVGTLQKCRVSLQYWSGSPASSARQQNATSMAFRWRADDGPFISVTKLSRFIALTKLSRSAHGACLLIILNQRTCRATECVECEITHMSKKRTQS